MDKEKLGWLHSVETMGLVDGPGIRTIFFMQGCPLRCAYCHNPDSQPFKHEKAVTAEDILRTVKRYRPYYGQDGGVTFSGGEPLAQAAFLKDTLKRLKDEGLHTCVDTSGVGDPADIAELVHYTDLFLLDVKQFDEEAYHRLTGLSLEAYKRFIRILKEEKYEGRLWIRHVMVPGMTDSERAMEKLVDFIEDIVLLVERLEILPYHVMGVEKYKQLGLSYRLEGVPPMDKERAKELEAYARRLLDERRRALLKQPALTEDGTWLGIGRRREIERFSGVRGTPAENGKRIKVNVLPQDTLDEFRRLPLLRELDEEAFKEVLGGSCCLTLKRGAFAFKTGERADRFYIIHSGRIKIYQNTPEGREQILYIYNPGDYVGGLNLITSLSYLYMGQALEDCRILAVSRQAFDKHMRNNPGILRSILAKSFDRIRWAEDLISRLYASNADIKAAALLLTLKDDFGKTGPEGTVLHLTINREEMGSYAGLTRETMTRKLSEFREAGYIEWIDPQTIIIKDVDALKRILESA